MKFSKVTFATMALAGACLLAAPSSVKAAGAGVSADTSSILNSATGSSAGVSLAFYQCLAGSTEEAAIVSKATVEANDAPVVASEYSDIAIAQVTSYVNVRSEASEEGEVLGKLYNNCAATVLGEENGWYQITSGSVTGYVKAEYVVVGDEALAKSVSRRVATVTTETLRVRQNTNTYSDIIGLVPEGEDLTVVDETTDGWVCVSIEEGNGYVSSDYVTLSTEYTYAESKEEEEARLAAEEAEREAAAAAARSATSSSKSSSSKSSGSGKSYSAPSGSDGASVASYACQFIGNPYSYGGSSLTNGTDCSGFVMSVYAAYGVSLPHSSSAMRSSGYEVSVDSMQPGDIVCYSGHVAIYVGNNTIVHASTPETGIKLTSPVNYKNILSVRRIF